MKRFYVFKDGVQKGSMETREEAVEIIRLFGCKGKSHKGEVSL